jgi:hypothetical protein
MSEPTPTKLLPIANIGNIASILLWVQVGMHVIGIPLFILFATTGPIKDGVEVSGMQVVAGLALVVWSVLQFVAYVATGITFLMWLYRADNNLVFNKVPGLKFTPFWAEAYWFVPLVNLLMPYRVMKEVFNASDPNAQEPLTEWSLMPVPKMLPLWWGFWIADSLGTGIASRIMDHNLTMGVGLQVLAMIFSIASARLAIKVVSEINHRQMHKFPELQTAK